MSNNTRSSSDNTLTSVDERAVLLEKLSGVKRVQLNHTRRNIFSITEKLFGGKSLLTLTCTKASTRSATFGENGVPKLSEFPVHGLRSLYDALTSEDLFNATDGLKDSLSTPIESERTKRVVDPFRSIDQAEWDSLVHLLNYEDGDPTKPARGNSLKSIKTWVEETRPKATVLSAILSIEKINNNRIDVIDFIETTLSNLESD